MERVRLKDRILDNISKSMTTIKDVCQADAEFTFSIEDKTCQKLCENMDHALLHGLRHITNGYWQMVKEFTHKSQVKELNQLGQVTTNLGRGRAWLYMALNEGILESYVKCFLESQRYLRKFYMKEAFILDAQRLSALVTFTANLDSAVFHLECDVPYLDLSASPPKSRRPSNCSSQSCDDDVSSMDSLLSNLSPLPKISSVPESLRTMTDSDYFSATSSCGDLNGCHSIDTAGCHSDDLAADPVKRFSADYSFQETGPHSPGAMGDDMVQRSFEERGGRMSRLHDVMVANDDGRDDPIVIREKSKRKKKKVPTATLR